MIDTGGPKVSSRNSSIVGRDVVDDHAFHELFEVFSPPTTLAPLATAAATSFSTCSTAAGRRAAQHDFALARIAGRQRRHALGELGDEFIGHLLVHHHPLGGHADLAGVGERAEHRGVDRRIDVGILQHDQRRLAAQLEQHRLQVLAPRLGDDAADRVEPVKFTRRTAGWAISASDTAARILGAWVITLTTPSPSPASCSTEPIRRWVAGQTSEALSTTVLPQARRHGDGAHAQDDRRVPGRDPQNDATGWRMASEIMPGTSDGMTLAGDLRGHGGGFAQHAGPEVDVETPSRGAAGLGHHQRGELGGTRLEQVGRLVELGTPRIGPQRRPGGERPRRGLDDLGDVSFAGRRRFARHRPGHRVVAGVCCRRRLPEPTPRSMMKSTFIETSLGFRAPGAMPGDV